MILWIYVPPYKGNYQFIDISIHPIFFFTLWNYIRYLFLQPISGLRFLTYRFYQKVQTDRPVLDWIFFVVVSDENKDLNCIIRYDM